MKIFKAIIAILLIFLIAFGIPFIIHNNIHKEKYYTQGSNANIEGPMGYYGLIVEDENSTQEIKTNAANLLAEYTNVLNGQRDDFYTLLLAVGILLSIFIITAGIIIQKTNLDKIFSLAFIVAGVLTAIAYLILYYINVIYL